MIYVLSFAAGFFGALAGAYAWARWGWISLNTERIEANTETLKIEVDTAQAEAALDELRLKVDKLTAAMSALRVEEVPQ